MWSLIFLFSSFSKIPKDSPTREYTAAGVSGLNEKCFLYFIDLLIFPSTDMSVLYTRALGGTVFIYFLDSEAHIH